MIGLAGWGLFVVLVAGVIIRPLSMLLLLASIFFAMRAKVAKTRLQQFTGIGATVAVFCGLALNPNQDPITGLNIWAQIVCAVLVLVCYLFASTGSKQPPSS